MYCTFIIDNDEVMFVISLKTTLGMKVMALTKWERKNDLMMKPSRGAERNDSGRKISNAVTTATWLI